MQHQIETKCAYKPERKKVTHPIRKVWENKQLFVIFIVGK